MFPELIEKKRVSFHAGFENWEDAIAASCAPLLEQGVVEQSYIDLIISNVKELGAYIVIAPNICIPHAQEGAGVHDTAVCFMKTEQPVKFNDDPDQDACIFFAFSSVNNDAHLENLDAVVSLLAEEEHLKKILAAKSVEDLRTLP